MNPIGQLKSKITKSCDVCSSESNRTIKVNVYENSESELERAKNEIKKIAEKKYTCNICKTILK